jgi:hypothetical protein
VLAREAGWDGIENGELLFVAQQTFDVLLTTDTNIYHQQKVAQFDIAVIVLRAYNNGYAALHPLLPDVLEMLTTIEPGKVYYAYADEKLKQSDRRKGKGPADEEQ